MTNFQRLNLRFVSQTQLLSRLHTHTPLVFGFPLQSASFVIFFSKSFIYSLTNGGKWLINAWSGTPHLVHKHKCASLMWKYIFSLDNDNNTRHVDHFSHACLNHHFGSIIWIFWYVQMTMIWFGNKPDYTFKLSPHPRKVVFLIPTTILVFHSTQWTIHSLKATMCPDAMYHPTRSTTTRYSVVVVVVVFTNQP